jgi:hypothetical protein
MGLTCGVKRTYHVGMQKADAIRHFGSVAKVAEAAGLKTRQAVYLWPEEVPDLYQYKLHHVSGGKLKLSPRLDKGRRA